jgi:hypothetical protein
LREQHSRKPVNTLSRVRRIFNHGGHRARQRFEAPGPGLLSFHEPSECGVRDAGCGTGGSCPRFSSSCSSSSLVLDGSWPVSRSERNRELSRVLSLRTCFAAPSLRPLRSLRLIPTASRVAPRFRPQRTHRTQRKTGTPTPILLELQS